MSFDLVDKDGGEIKATAWNDQVDMFQDMIQVGARLIFVSRIRATIAQSYCCNNAQLGAAHALAVVLATL
jgi:hypothetical protein